MPRRSSEPAHHSLFAFLDVLMCTMGALILLFVCLAGRMRLDAIERQTTSELIAAARAEAAAHQTAPAQPEPSRPEAPQVQPEPATARMSADERARLLAEQDAERARRHSAWQKALADARALKARRLETMDAQQQRMRDFDARLAEQKAQMEELDGRAAAIEQSLHAAAVAQQKLREQEQQFEARIGAARRDIDLAGRKQATAANEHALVPYDGTSGTIRRPIYIECTKHGFRFLPENEFIAVSDLQGFNEGYNPLLVGSQTLARYWEARRRRSGGEEPEPYVLLLVRPSGCLTYYIARQCLQTLSTPFGYELLDEDFKLSARESDAQSKTALHDALEIAFAARDKPHETASKLPGRRALGSLGIGPDGDTGDIATRGDGRGSLRGRGMPGGSLGQAGDGAGAAPGRGEQEFAQRAPAAIPGTSEFGRAGGAGSPAQPSRWNADGRPGHAGGASGDGAPANLKEAVAAGRAGAPGRGPARSPRAPGRPATFSGRSSDEELEQEGFGEVARRSQRGGVPSRQAGAAANDDPGDGLPPQLTVPEDAVRGRGSNRRVAVVDDSPPPGRLRTLEPDDDQAPGNGDMGGDGGRSSEMGDPFARRSGQGSARQPGQPGAGSATRGEHGAGSMQSGAPQGSVSVPLGSGSDQGGSNDEPQRGGRKQWGPPGRRSGIGLERKIEVVVRPDRLLIGPNQLAVPVHPHDKGDDLLGKVLGGIETAAEDWGAPPANFYWLPAVKFVVMPGANAYYERLRGPLQKWGVKSTVQYEQAGTAAHSGERRRS